MSCTASPAPWTSLSCCIVLHPLVCVSRVGPAWGEGGRARAGGSRCPLCHSQLRVGVPGISGLPAHSTAAVLARVMNRRALASRSESTSQEPSEKICRSSSQSPVCTVLVGTKLGTGDGAPRGGPPLVSSCGLPQELLGRPLGLPVPLGHTRRGRLDS